MTLTRSTNRRELRPTLAALVQAALNLKIRVTPEERKGTKGQREIPMEPRKDGRL